MLWLVVADTVCAAVALGITCWQSWRLRRLRAEAEAVDERHAEAVCLLAAIVHAPMPVAAPVIVEKARELLSREDIKEIRVWVEPAVSITGQRVH